jgi:uncharacterized membrane protein
VRPAAPGDSEKPVAVVQERVDGRVFALGSMAASVGALVVGGATLAREPLWNDELSTLGADSRSFPALLAELPHGSLYHVGVWPIIALGGTDPVWLRLPALLAFAGSVVLCALVGARLAGRLVGLIAAVLLALNPFAIHYGQEARMYSFDLFFSLLAIWALLRALENPDLARWLVYATSVAASVYSHDLALLFIPVHAVILLLTRADLLRRFLLALAAAIVLLLPVGLKILAQADSDPFGWITRPTPRSLYNFGLTSTGSKVGLAVCFIVLAAGGAALFTRVRSGRPLPWPSEAPVFVAAWLLGPVLTLFVISQVKPLFVDRYLLPTLPALCLGLAMALTLLGRRVVLPGAIILAVVFAVTSVRNIVDVTNPDWPGVAYQIQSLRNAGELEVAIGDTLGNLDALAYYQRDLRIDRDQLFWTSAELDEAPGPLRRMDDLERASQILPALVSGHPGAWLVIRGVFDPKRLEPVYRFAASCKTSNRSPFRGVQVLYVAGCPEAR